MKVKCSNILIKKIVAFAVIIGMICSGSVSYAADTVDELEGATSSLEGEINDLNSKADKLAAEVTKASEKLEKISKEMKETKKALAQAKLNEETQYSNMKARIKYMYEGGNTTFLELLLESGSMAEFLNNAEFITQISEYDRNMLVDYQTTREKVASEEQKLEAEKKELSNSKEELKEKQKSLESQISSKSSELSKYQAQLDAAKAAQAAAQAAMEEQARAQEQAQNQGGNASANNGGSSVDQSGKTENDGSNEPVSGSEAQLFAALLQAEAGSSYNGCLAVATVVMNRVRSSKYPNSVKSVIYQSGQFAPTWNGSLNRIMRSGACSNAKKAANAALGGARLASVKNCYSFRSAATTSHRGVNVGGNIFF